jgi:hypothetical protein
MKYTKKMKASLQEAAKTNDNGSCVITLTFGEYSYEDIPNALINLKLFWNKVRKNQNCFFYKYFCGFIKELVIEKQKDKNTYKLSYKIFATIKESNKLNLSYIREKIRLYYFRVLLITKETSDFQVFIKPVIAETYINELDDYNFRFLLKDTDEEFYNLIYNKKLISFHGVYHIGFSKLRKKRGK